MKYIFQLLREKQFFKIYKNFLSLTEESRILKTRKTENDTLQKKWLRILPWAEYQAPTQSDSRSPRSIPTSSCNTNI